MAFSNTEFVYFQGKCKWFRHTTPDQYNKYKHQIYLDEPSLAKFKELKEPKDGMQGILNVLHKDDDGYYVSISRPASKEIQGKVRGFVPPEVFLADGTPLKNTAVGNGSDVTTKVELYKYNIPGSPGKKGRAIRWLSSRIDTFIPFDGPDGDFTPNEARAVKGLDKQPAQGGANPF